MGSSGAGLLDHTIGTSTFRGVVFGMVGDSSLANDVLALPSVDGSKFTFSHPSYNSAILDFVGFYNGLFIFKVRCRRWYVYIVLFELVVI